MADFGFLFSPTLWIIVAAVYVYFAVCLSTIAAKTGTPDGWMAWIPLLNTLLMCRIGRKPGWMIVLLLIPLVNLIIFVVLWSAIAKQRGKSPAMGIMIVVPVLNLLLPLLLAIGPASGATMPPAPSTPAYAASPTVCPYCGSRECIGDAFCSTTGQRLPPLPGVSAAVPAAPAEPQTGMLAKVIVGGILAIAAIYFGIGLFSSAGKLLPGGDSAKQGKGLDGIPQRLAGTLTEFPVDTAANPARPSSVTTRSLKGRNPAPLPPNSMPPGVTTATLARAGDTMTTATYRAAPTDAPVSVSVVSKDSDAAAAQPIATAAASSGAAVTSVEVRNPNGETYTGYKVNSPQTVTIILDKVNAPILIVIYSADPAGKDTAIRLAGNVGNGNGLFDELQVASALQEMTVQMPAGLELVQSQTYSGSDLEGSLDGFSGAMNREFGPEAAGWISQVRSVIPPVVTASTYRGAANEEFKLVWGNYGSSLRSWATWQIVRATAGITDMHSVPMEGGDALSGVDSGTEYLLFRRGGCFGLVSGPVNTRATAMQLAQALRP